MNNYTTSTLLYNLKMLIHNLHCSSFLLFYIVYFETQKQYPVLYCIDTKCYYTFYNNSIY